MKVNAITKGLLIAIPALVLTACGATSDSTEGESKTTNTEVQQAETEGLDAVTDTVEVQEAETLEVAKTAEEMMQEKYDALRQQQTIYFDYDKSILQSTTLR